MSKNFFENLKVNLSSEITEQQKELQDKLTQVIDTYIDYTTDENKKRLDYTVAGLYFALREILPPSVKFRIDYRTKASRSEQKSTELEILDSSIDRITKDIFAMKIIVTSIDGRLDLDTNNPEYSKLISLENTKFDNIDFIEETRDWILSTSAETLKTEEMYYEKKCEILERLISATYENELMSDSEISYAERLERVSKAYSDKQKADNLSFSISKEQSNSLIELLDDLEARLNDKLERTILQLFVPKALNLNLMSNLLQVGHTYEKESCKSNGYVADYYILNLGNILKNVELQLQSNFRYLCGVSGNAYHNGMSGKSINIFSLFELVDENDSPYPLEHYLRILSQTSIRKYTDEIIKGSNSTLMQQVTDAYKHIKIKDKIQISHNPDFEENLKDYDMNEYLLGFAQYTSADMSTCRSAHNFDTPTVSIEKKDLSDSFAEVLRKRDGISCLAQLLVDRVKSMIDRDESFLSSYKTLTATDIISYTNTLDKSKDSYEK